MKPSEIQNFLKWRQQASLDDFARSFGLDQEQVRVILEQMIVDGMMRKHYISNCCNDGCEPCVPTLTEYYEWIE